MQQSGCVSKRAAWAFCGVLLLVAASISASAEDVDVSANVRSGGIDSQQHEQAGSRIHRSRALGLVDASVDQVTDVILDYANYREFMPNFVTSRVLSQRGSKALVYMQASALAGLSTLWAEMQLSMRILSASTRVVSARMLRGNLKNFQAEWHVTPFDASHSLVAFELCADPDFQLPFASGLVSDYNEKEAVASIVGLRQYLARSRAR